MNEAAQQPQAAKSINPFARYSNWGALAGILSITSCVILSPNVLTEGWLQVLAFFLLQGAATAIYVLKASRNKLRWGMIPCWLTLSVGLYCFYQFPERSGTIWASILALFAIIFLSTLAISKWQSAKKAESQ